MVLEAFVGPRPAGLVARHLDGNVLNCRPTNLCWGTQQENIADQERHGTHTRGVRNARASFSSMAEIDSIRARLAAGEQGRVIARELGVAEPTISNIRTRKTYV
jgi:hypothetical protein